jgi:tyrosine-protein kinase
MAVTDIYRALWRHKLFIVVVTSVIVAIAFVLTSHRTKLYTASSLVRVQQNLQNEQAAFSALQTGERLARTYESIAETDSVRDLTRARLRGELPADTFVVKATQLSNLELLRISVTDSDPVVAARVANAVPASLASFINETGTFRDMITVVERASPPTQPSSPNTRLSLALAVLLGLILGAGLALLKESVADRVGDGDELERISGHPIVASIPKLKFVLAAHATNVQGSVVPLGRGRGQVAGIETPPEREAAAQWGPRG